MGSGADAASNFDAAEGDKIAFGGDITVVRSGADSLIDLVGGNVITMQPAAVGDVTGHIIW